MLKSLSFLFLIIEACCFSIPSVDTLTLEEKVGQLMMVFFQGEKVNENARILFEKESIGNIIYYQWANGLKSPEQILALSNGLQQLAAQSSHGIPLLIAADQEGGVVERLKGKFTPFPGNGALGKTKDPKLTKAAALAMGREMSACGVNMNLAPVVDVNSNKEKPVIGVRSFGSNPRVVTRLGRAALKGFQQAGVVATLKHFPGYGAVSSDPHYELPVVNKSFEDLEVVELYPFKRLADQAEVIMTAHLMLPAIDDKLPATLSPKIISLLRKDIGFQGVIMSDSLTMQAVLDVCGNIDEAAIRALQAGHDLLCFGGKMLGQKDARDLTVDDLIRIRDSIVCAVRNGRISEQQIDCSVGRILRLKTIYHLNHDQIEASALQRIGTKGHMLLADKIAELSVKKIHDRLPTHQLTRKIIAPEILKGLIEDAFFYEGLNPSQEAILAATQLSNEVDMLIICTYNCWKHEKQRDLVKTVQLTGKKIAVITTRDDCDLRYFKDVDLLIRTASPTEFSLKHALKLTN